MPDLGPLSTPRLLVLGHPNHELAIYGFLQRYRPHLLYLTDGGGPERVDETRQSLASLGLLDHAVFLNHPEAAFYEALLTGHIALFQSVVDAIRDRIRQVAAVQVICESIEFYNPVHDVTLPMVRAAAAEPGVSLYEFPLIHELAGRPGQYRLQGFGPSRKGRQIALRLTDEEVAGKLAARDRFYHALSAQLGPVLRDVDAEAAAVEVFAPVEPAPPVPGGDVGLRYERRGRLLKNEGQVLEVITHAAHFVPFVAAIGSR